MSARIIKYPRTSHIEGSSLQQGDHDRSQVPFRDLAGLNLVVEEKLDGANSAFFFDRNGTPYTQSRGHLLDMTRRGGRERHFNLLKDWVNAHQDVFFERLGDRYRVYGEWMYAAHTIYYDALPHLFMEFDVWDHEEERFLDTVRRRELLEGLPIVSVPVLKPSGAEGASSGERGRAGLHRARPRLWDPAEEVPPGQQFRALDDMLALIGPSAFKTREWRSKAADIAQQHQLDVDLTLSKLEDGFTAEGLYVKAEGDGKVLERFKWVRNGFLQQVFDTNEHWLSKPILPNSLVPGTNIFDVTLPQQPQAFSP